METSQKMWKQVWFLIFNRNEQKNVRHKSWKKKLGKGLKIRSWKQYEPWNKSSWSFKIETICEQFTVKQKMNHEWKNKKHMKSHAR